MRFVTPPSWLLLNYYIPFMIKCHFLLRLAGSISSMTIVLDVKMKTETVRLTIEADTCLFF